MAVRGWDSRSFPPKLSAKPLLGHNNSRSIKPKCDCVEFKSKCVDTPGCFSNFKLQHIDIAQLNMSVIYRIRSLGHLHSAVPSSQGHSSVGHRDVLCVPNTSDAGAVCPISVAINQRHVPSLPVIEAIPGMRH